jgi:hypothetical protein
MTTPSTIKLSLLAFLALAGCSQVLGLGDYDIDPALDQNTGGTPSGPSGGSNAAGGDDSTGPGEGGAAGGDGGGNQAGTPGDAELIPCDSAVCCERAGGFTFGVELLSDGGFELGPVGDQSPWSEESLGGFSVITDSVNTGWKPKAGAFYAYLSGAPGEQTSLFSEVLGIPSDAGWLVVSGYRWFQIDAPVAENQDLAGIAVFPAVDDPVPVVPLLWNADVGFGATTTWTSFAASFDAAPLQGQSVYLALYGESDQYPEDPDPLDMMGPASSFLFDDVSFKAFACFRR